MKKTRIKSEQLKKLLAVHDLQKYDICKICGVSAAKLREQGESAEDEKI